MRASEQKEVSHLNRIALMVLKNLFIVPGAYSKLCHYAKHTDAYPEQEKYDHIRYIMQRAVQAGNIDLQVFGQEHIPTENGFLMCGNHQGLFDVVALVATYGGPLSCVFKKELGNVPLLKQIIACTKSFAMNREDVRQSMTVIQNVTREVEGGRRYVIFPEGTRSRQGNVMGEFHPGSFRAAMKAKCPILPIAYIDSFKPLDGKGSAPVAVQMHYLPPIPYEEYGHLKSTEVAALVKERIAQKIREATEEAK